MSHRWRLSALVFGVGVTLLATSSLTSVLQARATVTTIASNLVNPRGLNFGPDGALYVAEAGSGGSGPCIVGSDGLTKCYGATGGVRKIVPGSPPGTPFDRILDHLPSIAPTGGNLATGPHDVDFKDSVMDTSRSDWARILTSGRIRRSRRSVVNSAG